MTQDEFERAYAARSGMTVEEFREFWIGLPCACGDPSCEGWAAVDRAPRNIAMHIESDAPGDVRPGALWPTWRTCSARKEE